MNPLHAYRQEDERIARAWVGGVLLAFAVVIVLLTIVAVVLLQARLRRLPLAETVGAKPNPVSEVSNVRSDLFELTSAGTRLKQQQHAALGKFRWVDKQHGIVGLPIDVAIDLTAAEQK